MNGPGMSKMLIMLPAMLAMRSLDFADPDVLFYTRVAFAAVTLSTLAVIAYLYSRIQANQDTRTIRVPPPTLPSWASSSAQVQEIKEMTVVEYDHSEWKRMLQQTLISVGIVTFLHWKWEICPPLFIQCLMMPYTIYGNPLFKIYVLGQSVDKPGDELKRPFKDNSNPFAALTGQPTEDTAAAEKREKKEKKKQQKKQGNASSSSEEVAATSESDATRESSGQRKRNTQARKAD